MTRPQNSTQLINALSRTVRSRIFRKELNELTLYCSHIKQERQILSLLSKCIWNSKPKALLPCILEVEKKDMCLDGTTLQAKFSYEFDVLKKLNSEFEDFENELGKGNDREVHLAILKKKGHTDSTVKKKRQHGKKSVKSISWLVSLPVLRDIEFQSFKSDIFLWIVSCRDLRKFNNKNGLINDTFLKNSLDAFGAKTMKGVEQRTVKRAKRFLSSVCKIKRADISVATVSNLNNGFFRSSYIFIFCNVKNGKV